MNIREALIKGHSKGNARNIAEYISDDKTRFAELMTLFFEENHRICQRAAMVVGYCFDRYPQLITPYLQAMLDNLATPKHDAIKRNTVRILQSIDIPEELLGQAAGICFQYLESHHEPIAIKVFAMTTLTNIAQKAPGLKPEIRLLIEEQLPYASAGFKSRARKELKRLT